MPSKGRNCQAFKYHCINQLAASSHLRMSTNAGTNRAE